VRLRQVLLNLGGNAIKFTRRGEVVIRAGEGPPGTSLVRFSVSDTGIGIPEAARALAWAVGPKEAAPIFDALAASEEELLARIALTSEYHLGPQQRRAIVEALRKELFPYFHFEEMAKRSLGVHWKDRTPREREEFTRLFRDLLENAYVGKIEGYKGEKILYRKESVDLPYAEVNTVIVTLQGDEIPVDYRVLKDGARWRIYDIVIEGVSLVNNYRSQFAGILQKSSYPELVRRLKSTIQQQEKG